MSAELETLGAASAGGLTSRQRADRAGEPCYNCGTPVEKHERYCPNCGQLAASFHRPLLSLIGETISDTLTVDGRLARTIPILFLRPGFLTKSYTAGKRARYVPPFRLFLLASLVFYIALFNVIGDGSWLKNAQWTNGDAQVMTAEEVTDLEELIRDEGGNIDPAAIQEILERDTGEELDPAAAEAIDRTTELVNDPRVFIAELQQWAPRLSFLLVPFTILALTMLHIWRRKLYVYHHAIHALHLHTWIYLAATLMIVLLPYLGGWIGWVFGIGFVIYVWRSLKVAGETGYLMSFLRLLMLLIFWSIIVSLTVLAAIIISGVFASGALEAL